MEGETRREAILAHLEAENKPVSGSRLSQLFGVSRQVIVQDIALIRATNKNILSTNKGYVLYKPEHISTKCKRIFPVFHTTKQIKKELYTIVDLGGTVLDVIVEHDVYGMITVDLILKNRTDVDEFSGQTSRKSFPATECPYKWFSLPFCYSGFRRNPGQNRTGTS